mmetsp:Transcript_23368/g.73126  ORF Transcript_23368/g.73126 Transcript_23368/m.73126 type:complete len:804 (+) Transcript_23368:483-2894(+)
MVSGACAIEELHLEHCIIGDRGCTLLAEALAYNRTLRRVNLRHTGVGNAGAMALGDMLVENSTLQTLLLGWNNIQAAGARQLAAGAKFNPGLLELDISHNGLGDVGATHIGFMLIDNGRLERVDVSRNHVGSAACMVLSEAIKKNTTLKVLEMNDNPLGAACVRIFEAMAVNDVLEKVGLQGSNFQNFQTHANASVQFNPQSPNGKYRLSLDEPFHNQVAKELVRLRDKHGKDSWRDVQYNGLEFVLTDLLNWPDRMPEKGTLELTFLAEEAPPDGVLAMEDMDFENVQLQLADLRADDMWRIALLKMVSTSYYFTSRQGAKLLGCFQWEAGRREAAVIIFGRVLDTQNISILTEPLSADETKALYLTLGIHTFFHSHNPSGSYSLLLSKQVDRLVASRLLEAATKEGHYRLDPFKINWRHVFVNSQPVDNINLDTLQLPRSGTLRMFYMSYEPVPADAQPPDAFAFLRLMKHLKVILQMEVDMMKRKLQLEAASTVIGILRTRRLSQKPKSEAGRKWLAGKQGVIGSKSGWNLPPALPVAGGGALAVHETDIIKEMEELMGAGAGAEGGEDEALMAELQGYLTGASEVVMEEGALEAIRNNGRLERSGEDGGMPGGMLDEVDNVDFVYDPDDPDADDQGRVMTRRGSMSALDVLALKRSTVDNSGWFRDDDDAEDPFAFMEVPSSEPTSPDPSNSTWRRSSTVGEGGISSASKRRKSAVSGRTSTASRRSSAAAQRQRRRSSGESDAPAFRPVGSDDVKLALDVSRDAGGKAKKGKGKGKGKIKGQCPVCRVTVRETVKIFD